MEYYCFEQDFNSNEFVWFNILNKGLIEEIEYLYKHQKTKDEYWKIKTKDDFKERIRRYFSYRYWGKTERECILKNWSGHDLEMKIDVYWQILPNLNLIIDIICNAMDIKFDSKDKILW